MASLRKHGWKFIIAGQLAYLIGFEPFLLPNFDPITPWSLIWVGIIGGFATTILGLCLMSCTKFSNGSKTALVSAGFGQLVFACYVFALPFVLDTDDPGDLFFVSGPLVFCWFPLILGFAFLRVGLDLGRQELP